MPPTAAHNISRYGDITTQSSLGIFSSQSTSMQTCAAFGTWIGSPWQSSATPEFDRHHQLTALDGGGSRPEAAHDAASEQGPEQQAAQVARIIDALLQIVVAQQSPGLNRGRTRVELPVTDLIGLPFALMT